MHLHYLLIAHKNPEQLKRLVDRISFEHSSIYIHIDKNSNIKPFKDIIPDSSRVQYVPDADRIESKWCDIGTVNATLALYKLVDTKAKPGYCILMSGQDYPVKSNAYIYDYFKRNSGAEFINIFSLPNPIWLNNGLLRLNFYKVDLSAKKGDLYVIPSLYNKEFYSFKNIVKTIICVLRGRADILKKITKKRVYPQYLSPHGGDTWWTLSTQILEEILAFMDNHPDYYHYHHDTFCPDETMFHSIIPELQKRRDFQVLANTTFANWNHTEIYQVGWFSSYQLPGCMQLEDWKQIQELPESTLYARKFDIHVDASILDKIDAELLQD
ncbi:MAG: beta-1,6-N-acetylglucosaminyltransferase [Bacteroidia bacterium]